MVSGSHPQRRADDRERSDLGATRLAQQGGADDAAHAEADKGHPLRVDIGPLEQIIQRAHPVDGGLDRVIHTPERITTEVLHRDGPLGALAVAGLVDRGADRAGGDPLPGWREYVVAGLVERSGMSDEDERARRVAVRVAQDQAGHGLLVSRLKLEAFHSQRAGGLGRLRLAVERRVGVVGVEQSDGLDRECGHGPRISVRGEVAPTRSASYS